MKYASIDAFGAVAQHFKIDAVCFVHMVPFKFQVYDDFLFISIRGFSVFPVDC